MRNNFSIQAGQADWSLMYYNRFIGETEWLGDRDETVDSVLYHNVVATYFINDGVTVSLGVKNLTDEEPSYVPNGSDGGTIPEVFDTIGRQIYGGLTMKF